MKFLKNLQGLDISYNNIRSLRPLSSLKNLRTLNFRNNQVELLGPLRFLTELRFVNASYNRIGSTGPLHRPGIRRLYLHGNIPGDRSWLQERSGSYDELVLTEFGICERERRRALERGWADQEEFEIYSE